MLKEFVQQLRPKKIRFSTPRVKKKKKKQRGKTEPWTQKVPLRPSGVLLVFSWLSEFFRRGGGFHFLRLRGRRCTQVQTFQHWWCVFCVQLQFERGATTPASPKHSEVIHAKKTSTNGEETFENPYVQKKSQDAFIYLYGQISGIHWRLRRAEMDSWEISHRSETHGIAEWTVQRVQDGTSSVLVQSGLQESWWAEAVECYCYLCKYSQFQQLTGCTQRRHWPVYTYIASSFFSSSVCPQLDTDQLYNTQWVLHALTFGSKQAVSQVISFAIFQKQVQSHCHLVLHSISSSVLAQSGLQESWWAEAVECDCNLRNVQDLHADNLPPSECQFNSPSEGPIIPSGAKVNQFLSYISKRRRSSASVRHKRRSWNIHAIRIERGTKLDWWSFDSGYGGSQHSATIWNSRKDSNQKEADIIKRNNERICVPMQDGRNRARRTAVINLRRQSPATSFKKKKKKTRDPFIGIMLLQERNSTFRRLLLVLLFCQVLQWSQMVLTRVVRFLCAGVPRSAHGTAEVGASSGIVMPTMTWSLQWQERRWGFRWSWRPSGRLSASWRLLLIWRTGQYVDVPVPQVMEEPTKKQMGHLPVPHVVEEPQEVVLSCQDGVGIIKKYPSGANFGTDEQTEPSYRSARNLMPGKCVGRPDMAAFGAVMSSRGLSRPHDSWGFARCMNG